MSIECAYNEVTREVNLDFFCHDTRPELLKPFSIRDHSYASNGHWLVRVARRVDIVELDDEVLFQRVLKVISEAGQPGNVHEVIVSLPPATEIACTACGGNGKEHSDCPCCECECSFCDGDGICSSDTDLSVGIGASSCSGVLIRHLLTLPKFRIAPRSKKQNSAPLWFSFDGGDGLLMPLHGKSGTHIIAEVRP